MHDRLPAPGDLVWIRRQRWRVERARCDRRVVRLDVRQRHRRLTFLAPFDRPATVGRARRPRHASRRTALARLAGVAGRTVGARAISAALDARVAILPHQLEPALAIVAGVRRVLIADDVGLGKTIQAGLVIAELARRCVAPRILVLVPPALRDQWAAEIDRFGLECRTADQPRMDMLVRGAHGDNPWRRSGIWIASPDYVKQPHVFGALPELPWDLVVIDEAHTVCGASDRHSVCDQMTRRARHVVLLTATPHDGDASRFARLLDLGALPGGAAVDDELTVFRRTRHDVGLPADRRVRWSSVPLSEAEVRMQAALAGFERETLAAAGQDRRDAALLLLSVFRKRALSTAGALAISLERRLAWLTSDRDGWQQPRLAFDAAPDDLAGGEEHALCSDVGLGPHAERAWLRRLLVLSEAARRHERKVGRLATLLQRTAEPVVIFTEFRHSLDVLARRLRQIRPLAVLHGGQAPAERRLELDRFLTGPATALIATDVASLGLNLQHRARWVISLELPWNPARLEQRAGRVDRLGQTRPVHVTLLVARHESESRVLLRLAQRTMAARRAVGPDALGGAPDDGWLRNRILTGPPLAAPDDVAAPEDVTRQPDRIVTISRRWRRQARRHACDLERGRRLASQWRAPDGVDAAPIWTVVDRLPPGPEGRDRSALLVFAVPIVTPAGETIERRMVAVEVDRRVTPHLARGRPVIDAAAQVAASRAAPRVRRLARWLAERVVVATARERAISEAAAGPDHGRLVLAQPGLFDERELRAAEDAAARRADVSFDLTARVDALAESADVRAGVPLLVVAWLARS